MRRIAIAVTVLLACARFAHAADAFGWRDGCPAGDMQRKPDIQIEVDPKTGKLETLPPYPGTDARATGMAPELDSALVPGRFLIAPAFVHFARDAGATTDVNRARMLGARAQIDYRLDFPSVFDEVGLTLSTVYFGVFPNDVMADGTPTPTPSQLGNVVVAVSVAHHWMASPNVPESSGGLVAGLRNAVAGRLSIAPFPSNSDPAASALMLQRTAFEGTLFDPNRLIDGSLEARTEGVGCYSPFLHLRLRVAGGTAPDSQHVMILAPQTLAAGMTVAPALSIMLEYGLLFSYTTGPVSQALLGTNVLHRFRAGAELAHGSFSAGFHLDGFLGSSLYQGTAFELYIALAPSFMTGCLTLGQSSCALH